MIEIDDVSVRFGDVEILSEVSLSARKGELVGLVGPNGAGKTTLLRAVSGALEPDVGTVRVGGADVHELGSAAASRRVAVLPQDTSLAFEFDVREVVAMGRHPYRSRFGRATDRDRAHVDRALARTQTTQLADRPIGTVSGGERQRVLIARAIAQDAPALLLDEPTASLDPNHALKTMELLDDLVDDGRTALAAIHDLPLATRYCDRIAVLSGGRVVDVGVPERVLTVRRIEEVFDVRAIVRDDPVGGLDVRPLPPDELDVRVHVIGGGSTAAAVVGRLGAAGVSISIGPISEGERATDVCRGFDGDVVTVPRFSEITPSVRRRTRESIAASDVTVLADPDVTSATADWLELAADAERLVTVEERAPADRVDDAFADRYAAVRDTGAVTSLGGLLAAVRQESSTSEGQSEDVTTEATGE